MRSECSPYVRIHGATSAQDVIALRVSRVGILEHLIAFARKRMAGLLLDFSGWSRVLHWMRLAIALQARIRHGALDAPSKPRAERPERLLDYEREAGSGFP